MNKYLSVIIYDFKNTRRDPTLLLLLWMPVFMVVTVRMGIPALESYIPSIRDFAFETVVFFALLNTVFPGVILAFILLDEKDLHLIPVIKTTPVSLSGFLLMRIILLGIFGFISGWIIFFYNGLVQFSLTQTFAASFLCTLNAPIIILLISTKAKNKIEGLTLLKVANITLILPLLIFFIESPWENLFAVFPAFWVYAFLDSPNSPLMVFICGVTVLFLMNYFVYNYAKRFL